MLVDYRLRSDYGAVVASLSGCVLDGDVVDEEVKPGNRAVTQSDDIANVGILIYLQRDIIPETCMSKSMTP